MIAILFISTDLFFAKELSSLRDKYRQQNQKLIEHNLKDSDVLCILIKKDSLS